MRLGRQIAHFFDATGYYKGTELVPEPILKTMTEVVVDNLDRAVPPLRVNAEGDPCRVDQLLDRHPVFLEALRSSAVAEPLKEILGPVVEVVRRRHNHATRNSPGDIPFRLHRDVQQWSQPLVAVFIYLEDSSVKNGCTTIVPGTHRIPYAGPQSDGGGGNWADEHAEYRLFIGQELPVEMSRGGVLFLNCLCFHSVGDHLDSESSRTRYSAVFACRAADELASTNSPDIVHLFGKRRYVGNDSSQVSGSLMRSLPKMEGRGD